MPPVKLKLWICGLLLLGAVMAGRAAEPANTVAVLDFSVPAAGSNQWAWAAGGLADLLQIQLQQQGLMLLDRNSIHAVLNEHRLAAEGRTAQDNLALGELLNARYLITGRVTPLDDGRFRIEAGAFSVEAVETVVTGTGDGDFPKGLTLVLQSVAKQIGGKLQSPGAPAQTAPPAATGPKPEALILFYRGLNACAHGQPDWGAACFMAAASLDPDFRLPLLWEIKAYELGGFPQFAALRRQEINDLLKKSGGETAGRTNPPAWPSKPVFAVLNPLVTAPVGNLDASALGTDLTRALLETDQVRVFAFEGLGAAVAEQDLGLSAYFTSQNAPQYGRWLAPDGLVFCRLSAGGTNMVSLELSLINPLNTAVMARVQRDMPAAKLSGEISGAVQELLAAWKKWNEPGASPGVTTEPFTSAGYTDLRPLYGNLAAALARVRSGPEKSAAHDALAAAFGATGRGRLADFEAELSRQILASHASELPPLDPKSLEAGCQHYNLAVNAWKGENWPEAVTQAQQCRQIMQPIIATYDRNDQSVNGGGTDCEVLAATYFLEGASLVKQGKPEEARPVFHQGLGFMKSYKVRDFCLPLGPYPGDFFGPKRVYGYGGDAPGIQTRIEAELVVLEGKPYRPPGLDLRLDAEDIVTATNAPTRTKEEWLQCARQVAGILEQAPAGDSPLLKSILVSARTCLGNAHSKGAAAADLQPLAGEFVGLILAKEKVPAWAETAAAPVPALTEAAGEVLSLYDSAGLKEEAWALIEPLLDEGHPIELSLNLLQQLVWEPERYAKALDRVEARLPSMGTNGSAAVWLQLAQIYQQSQRSKDTLACDQIALAQGAPVAACPGLSQALLEIALDSYPAHARAEITRLREQHHLPPVEPSWLEWFETGQRYRCSAQFDLQKAAACYGGALDLLEHPEETGVYRLEKQGNSDRLGLRWKADAGWGSLDPQWSDLYNERWGNSTYFLAQTLIELDQKEEAAQWLRQLALREGGDSIYVPVTMNWTGGHGQYVQIGVRAAEQLKQLHLDGGPAFGEADGPYKRPALGTKARSFADLPPPPAPNPDILRALTNLLATTGFNPRAPTPNPPLQTFVQTYGHDAVPALLSLLPHAGERWDEAALGWLLAQTATPAEAPYVVAACQKHWGLIAGAKALDLKGTAEVISEEWRSQSKSGDVSFFFIFAVIDARLRPLYPQALDHIAERKLNHHSVVFRMEEVVNEEHSEELETAFRQALGRCLKNKVQSGDYYEMPRIAQIALRHGVPEAIDGLLAYEESSPGQLRADLGARVDLPAGDEAMLAFLRANRSRWEWQPGEKKFAPAAPGKS